ncbi:hypothetical protein [Dactylosporangium sp. CA-092794]|uniref:hypothetical protein n=1 Tax=Dactylosporangium sp. CA-092794 TaxID=3239929 RepID=UPI003D928104
MDMPPIRAGRIVIVGASLAGLRAAEALREEGYGPYDRPLLSKQALSGRIRRDATGLPRRADLDARWRLGVRAIGLDLPTRRVQLSDGANLPFDRRSGRAVPPEFAAVDRPDQLRPVPAGVPEPRFLARDATVVVTGHRPTTVRSIR